MRCYDLKIPTVYIKVDMVGLRQLKVLKSHCSSVFVKRCVVFYFDLVFISHWLGDLASANEGLARTCCDVNPLYV